MIEILPGATVKCGVVHMLVPKNKLYFVNTKVGLGFTFNLLKQPNKDIIINSLSSVNKSMLPITIQHEQQLDLCFLWKLSIFPVMFYLLLLLLLL